MRSALALGSALLLLVGCDGGARGLKEPKAQTHTGFPAADRPVATIVSARWSTEEARDRLNEGGKVMGLAGIEKGMTVADIGAGEGYYTIRLAQRVGEDGRVVAEDIVPETIEALGKRVLQERLDNVSVRLGLPADPRLPEASFHRVLMVHMYHEIESPYEFLWRLRPSLTPDGQVIVVDADRPTEHHGTPPDLLKCEFAAVGYALVSMRPMPSAGGYIAMFKASGARPEPGALKACKSGARATPAAVQQGQGSE
ncbi:class I SAM-dependent methyltransferase [Sphingomonas sp. LM7]|uniref:class I SAM-dependent methyltransferase n=1 Tax=Sphingomonas sp. LM7 TaxID=1938607 RepID=UPI0015C53F82|nr:methyltransferase domain-containing protein [Sphingomonas sp. LM7]